MAAEGSATTPDAAEQTDPIGQDGDGAESIVVKRLDFSQPSKFTPELRRRIAGAVGDLGESLSAALSANLRTEVELVPGESEQHTWAAAKARLAPDAVAVALGEGAPEQAMLLALELPLVLQALECMLGGKAAQAPAERHLSEIDWALAKTLVDTIASELSAVWQEIGGGTLKAGGLDLEGDGGVALQPAEPTLVVSLQGEIDGCKAGLSLLLPFVAAEPLLNGTHGAAAASHPDGAETRALTSGLAGAQVLLRAEVGSVQMPIEQMLAIGAGGVVELDERAQDGVLLYAEEVSIARGQPGASGSRKALKLESVAEQPERAETYATLGRHELERARADVQVAAAGDGGEVDGTKPAGPALLRSLFVRVWAELGRTHMALGDTLGLAPGALIELEQAS